MSKGKQGTEEMPSELCGKNRWKSERYITTEVFNPERAVSQQREQSVSSPQENIFLSLSLSLSLACATISTFIVIS